MKIKILLTMFAFISTEICLAQGTFTVVGIHPGASLQSTSTGKQILTLFPWRGKLYAGYGDYSVNTGPIKIYSFNIASRTFSLEWTANTEAIYNFRELNGQVYAPAIDRRSYTVPGDYSKMDSTGNWADYNFVGSSTHVYDAERFKDSVLFMAGSKDSNAVLWRSLNNGKTWQIFLKDTAIGAFPACRFYIAAVFNNKLYTQATDYPYSQVYDGINWTRGPDLFPFTSGTMSGMARGWHPDNFAGKMVYREQGLPLIPSKLLLFDGVNVTWADSLYIFDSFIYANTFYALVDSGSGKINLRSTSDLVQWQNLLSVPSKCRSLAILNDTLYLGTTASEILQYSVPVSRLTDVRTVEQNNFEFSIYPNPSNSSTTIRFSLLNASHVTLKVYDVLGKEVATLVYGELNTGKHSVVFNANNLEGGVYFYCLLARGFVDTRKMFIMK